MKARGQSACGLVRKPRWVIENLGGDIAARGGWVSAWGLEQQGPLDFNRRAVGNH